MKKKRDLEDDGRVIADMNVEGTPWYVPKNIGEQGSNSSESNLTPKETFHLISGALTAGLIIGMIFVLGCFLFILFCTNIWLK